MQEREKEQENVTTEIGTPLGFKEACFGRREDLERIKSNVIVLMNHPDFKDEQISQGQHTEMKANIMLAYRHLEDARMRIGKAVQAYDGGTSCYPR